MTKLVPLQEVVVILGRCCPQCRAAGIESLARLATVTPSPALAIGLRALLLGLCELHGVAYEDVIGPLRHAELIAVRQEFAFAARARGCSLAHIGRMLHRTHSTVFNYLKRLPAALPAGPAPPAPQVSRVPH